MAGALGVVAAVFAYVVVNTVLIAPAGRRRDRRAHRVGGRGVVGPGEDLDRALRAADACLYAAKRGGRNQVRVAGDGKGAVEVPAPRAAGDALRR